MPNNKELNRLWYISMREHYAAGKKKLHLTGKWGEGKNVTPEVYQKASVVFVMIYFLGWVVGTGYS